jgi:hypothetical protein
MRTGILPGARTMRCVRALLVATLGLSTGACFATPERPFVGPDPADPKTRVASTAYRPALSGYVSQRPVEPAPWRQQNERVAPAPKQ